MRNVKLVRRHDFSPASIEIAWGRARDLRYKPTAVLVELEGQQIRSCVPDSVEVGKFTPESTFPKYGNSQSL